jgi:hypothetical protein
MYLQTHVLYTGKNPIVIAANKVDLLPKDVSNVRLINWIHQEVKEYCDLLSPKDSENEVYISMNVYIYISMNIYIYISIYI